MQSARNARRASSVRFMVCALASAAAAALVIVATPGDAAAATRTENFDLPGPPANWVGLNNTGQGGSTFGFQTSNLTGGASPAGEAGGVFARSTNNGYYADTTIGTLTQDDVIHGEGEFYFNNGASADNDFALGHQKPSEIFEGFNTNILGIGIFEGSDPAAGFRFTGQIYTDANQDIHGDRLGAEIVNLRESLGEDRAVDLTRTQGVDTPRRCAESHRREPHRPRVLEHAVAAAKSQEASRSRSGHVRDGDPHVSDREPGRALGPACEREGMRDPRASSADHHLVGGPPGKRVADRCKRLGVADVRDVEGTSHRDSPGGDGVELPPGARHAPVGIANPVEAVQPRGDDESERRRSSLVQSSAGGDDGVRREAPVGDDQDPLGRRIVLCVREVR